VFAGSYWQLYIYFEPFHAPTFMILIAFLCVYIYMCPRNNFFLFVFDVIIEQTVSEFNEFKPRLESPRKLSAGLNLEKCNTNLSETNKIWARLKCFKFGLCFNSSFMTIDNFNWNGSEWIVLRLSRYFLNFLFNQVCFKKVDTIYMHVKLVVFELLNI